tara:strand:- start:406 stop:945 length:540 start_codon:yes stop_codon:yes gene_type:complete
MAKLIILEGLSRTGKTTIANNLRDNGYGRIVSLKEKMPECKDMTSFYKGCFYSYDAFFEAFPDETFILDRSFLSEMVYPELFERPTSIDANYIHEFVNNHEIHLFLLTNQHSDYIKRSPKDRFFYTETDYDILAYLFNQNLGKVERYIESDIIDTSENSIKQTITLIKSKLWKKTKAIQ